MLREFDAMSYWETRLRSEYSLRGVGDIGLSEAYNTALYDVRQAAFRHILARDLYGHPIDRVLDIGSGTGFYVDQWLQSSARCVMGSDLTEFAVAKLSKRFPKAGFTQFDIGGQLPAALEGRHFDAVTAFDILFHIVDDDKYRMALKNFAQLIRPGGVLIFSDNLSPSTKIRLEHQVSRSESFVFSELLQAGFGLVRVRPMFVLMNDPVRSRNRILRKLFSLIYRYAARGEREGRRIGTLLRPIEIHLIRLLSRGPSTEIFIWTRNED